MRFSQLRRLTQRMQIGAALSGAFAAVLLQAAWTPAIAFASNTIHHFITGTIDYEDTTGSAIIDGVQSGSGIGVEGVTNTGAPAGAIALDGFGTSTTAASVGVNGSVDGPGSTALIGNANDTTGAASIGLEGFSANGEGVFAESTNNSWPSLRSVDDLANYDVRLSDVPDLSSITALLNTSIALTPEYAVVGDDTVNAPYSYNVGVLGETTSGMVGVEGIAGGNASAGVYGEGNGTNTVGVDGVSATSAGVEGASGSNDAGFFFSNTGDGVYAFSETDEGEYAFSDDDNGIEGDTYNESDTTDVSEVGVLGVDQSTDGGFLNFGVEGTSTTGIGVEGLSSSYDGVEGGSDGSGAYGVYGYNESTENAETAGVLGFDYYGTGVWGEGSYGLVGECAGNDDDEYFGIGTNGFDYAIDCTGSASIVVRSRNGEYALATTPKSTQPVLEDYGEAQLVNGFASVRLDSAYAATISDATPYLVFVTPDGDTNGLYVTNKTMRGFQVREVRGGHSTLTFDYRIVAKPTGDSHPRMALMASLPPGPTHLDVSRLPHTDVHAAIARIAAHARAEQARGHVRASKVLARPRAITRLPIYEPRMGADGKLHPGQPYHPSTGG